MLCRSKTSVVSHLERDQWIYRILGVYSLRKGSVLLRFRERYLSFGGVKSVSYQMYCAEILGQIELLAFPYWI